MKLKVDPVLFGPMRLPLLDRLIPYMGKNVVVVITTTALLAIGFLFA